MRLNGIGLLFIAAGAVWVLWQVLKVEDAPPEPSGRVLEFPMSHVQRAAQFYDWEVDA